MKNALLALALLVSTGSAADQAAEKPAAPHAHADAPAGATADTAHYPLKTCVVSDEDLGSMGEAYRYTHKVAGKPDRLVLLCCESCLDDFKKDPASYLAKLDAATQPKK